MSRFKRFAHALVSGYVLLAVQTLFTLASVPLALRYLSNAEFGLWALTSQVAGYLALLDFGMSGAQSRILIDYKDDSQGTRYGSTILAGLMVGVVQGVIVLLAGGLVLWNLGPLPNVSPALDGQFRRLMFGQCAVLGAILVTRILSNVFWAHQRSDVGNINQIVVFAVNFGVMWLGFANGAGVLSLLWGQVAGVLAGLALALAGCVRLKLLPARGRWGQPSWERFRELFGFGKDVFLFSLGSQMINMSQTLLIAPLLGFEAAGVWAVCIRPYSVVVQLVWRVLDYSATPLSEMLVRGEHERFANRFRSVTVLTGVMAVAVGVCFAVMNQPFVQLWTHGRVSWPAWNDLLLAVWCLFHSVQRCHTGVLGLKKQLGTVKYVYFAEGLVFVVLAMASARWLGFSGVIGSSLAATMSISFLFGLWRTRTDFSLQWRDVLDWMRPAGLATLFLGPLAAAVYWLATPLPPVPFLAIAAVVLGPAAVLAVLRHGLDASLQRRVAEFVPSWAKGLLPRSTA